MLGLERQQISRLLARDNVLGTGGARNCSRKAIGHLHGVVHEYCNAAVPGQTEQQKTREGKMGIPQSTLSALRQLMIRFCSLLNKYSVL